MKIDNFNKWLTLIANLGVVAGLLFLGLELQQSSRITERELAISRADNVHGTFVNNEFLSEAVLKLIDIGGIFFSFGNTNKQNGTIEVGPRKIAN